MNWIALGLIALILTLTQNEKFLKKQYKEEFKLFLLCCLLIIILGPIAIMMCLFDFIFPSEYLEEWNNHQK